MVEHTSRCTYDDMRFLCKLLFLRGKRLLAEQSDRLNPLEAPDVRDVLLNLCSQLPGRCQYQSLRLVLRPVYPFTEGDAERCGFAAAGL
ncbi:hypothetical protein D3C74_470890 [compost metagenome]